MTRTSGKTLSSHRQLILRKKAVHSSIVAPTRPTPGHGNGSGVTERIGSYTGPRHFSVESRAGTFLIHRDDLLYAPTGCFRVEFQGREIGRQLSYPDAEDCMHLLHEFRQPRH